MSARTLLFAFCGIAFNLTGFAADFELGEAIVLSPEELKAHTVDAWPVAESTSGFTNGQVSGFTVDTFDRTDVLSLYHCIYQASEGFEARMGWVGNIPACWEGTVSSAFHDDTLRRIHYYRAMTGLGTGITFDPAKNDKCQKAALIMARNNLLSHFPTNTLPCWTADGYEAAGKSNLSRGTGSDYTGPRAVDGQIRDNGASNVPVGHRRWLLYPPAQEMGNGGLPEVPGYSAAAAVWVIGNFGSRPPSPPWVSWPNQGYVPYDLVPARWSLSMEGADFDTATVTMTRNSVPLPLTKVHPTPAWPAAGIGDPSIVWEPLGIPGTAPTQDDTYAVTVSGIVGGISNTVTYQVILMDPYTLNEDMIITGPEYPHAFLDNSYTFTTFAEADSYHLRIRKIADSAWLEGAEDTPTPQIIDGTHPNYALRQSDVKRTGSKAFHMAFTPDAPGDQHFEVDRNFVPSAASSLDFAYLRRYSHTANLLSAQVSTNAGATWSTVWSVHGICGSTCGSDDWDSAFIPVNQSLTAFAGIPCRLRFELTLNGGYYQGDATTHGFFVDDVAVTDAGDEIGVIETDLPGTATTFTLHPDGVYSYIMDMYVELGCHVFDYGPVTAVSSVPGLWISRMEELGGQVKVGFDVTGGAYSAYGLERMPAPVGAWSEDTGAAYNAGLREFTTTGTGPTLYRVTGDL